MWKHVDQLHFYLDIETEVKDRVIQSKTSLHPIPHAIEPNQSSQTTTSPPSNNTLSDNPTSTSSSQSPDNPVPIEPNMGTSPQQSDRSLK